MLHITTVASQKLVNIYSILFCTMRWIYILALLFRFANTVACGIRIHQHTRTERNLRSNAWNEPSDVFNKEGKQKQKQQEQQKNICVWFNFSFFSLTWTLFFETYFPYFILHDEPHEPYKFICVLKTTL